jgi:hypothetical protein
MWIWLRSTCVPFYDLYWIQRGAEEFEDMFGRQPFFGPAFKGVDERRACELLRRHIRKTTIHWGEGHVNPSTIASLFALVEEELVGVAPLPPHTSARGLRFLRSSGGLKNP